MIYAYHCDECGHAFDVAKPVSEYRSPETCGKCGKLARKEFVPRRTHLYGTKVQEAEFNPGLGCITRNKAHRDEIARQRGLEEIGTAQADTLHKEADTRRHENWERGWAETTKGWVGNGE